MKTIKYISSALVLALALGSCGKDKAAAESEEKEDIPVVKTMKVGEQDVDQLNVYTASVEPEVINNISAQMANRIKAIYVDEGVKVGKGQKLVMLDDVNTTQYELAVDNAKAALRNAQTHPLTGNYAGHMECHLEGDFLLIWFDPHSDVISLVRLGSHSELFG